MNQQTFNLISGLLFLAVALMHLYRAAVGGPLVFGEVDVPMWASWLAVIAAGVLASWALRLFAASKQA